MNGFMGLSIKTGRLVLRFIGIKKHKKTFGILKRLKRF